MISPLRVVSPSSSLLLLVLCACSGASATPLDLALWGDAQLCDEDVEVYGARLGVFGENAGVHGLDAMLVGGVMKRGAGVSIGPAFVSSEHYTGLQFGFFSANHQFDGVMIGGFTNAFGWFHSIGGDGPMTTNGVELGLLTFAGGMRGVQAAPFVNQADDLVGLQLGGYNEAERLGGVQLGLCNVADSGGVQFGLLNFKRDGFLPVFPLINF